MALKNFLVNNSYSVITSANYCKQSSMVVFTLATYSDNTKTNIVHNTDYMLHGDSDNTVISINLNKPPKNPKELEAYITGSEPTNEWVGNPNCYVVFYEGIWQFRPNFTGPFYLVDEDKYYNIIDNEYVEAYNIFDKNMWDKILSVEKLSENGNNILKILYNYLRTRIEFAGVNI